VLPGPLLLDSPGHVMCWGAKTISLAVQIEMPDPSPSSGDLVMLKTDIIPLRTSLRVLVQQRRRLIAHDLGLDATDLTLLEYSRQAWFEYPVLMAIANQLAGVRPGVTRLLGHTIQQAGHQAIS
jgi:hypothetical protein